MNPVWLLTTCARPEGCQQVLDACKRTGMTSPGIVWVDKHAGSLLYSTLRVPDNWTVVHAPKWGSLAQGMRWVMEQFPDASQYGWLSDDTYPRTPEWDGKLEEAAGRTYLSYAKDLWLSEDKETLGALERGADLSSGLCWGGDLVRAVGWWALPGTRQAGIDTAWTAIVGKLRRNRYLPDVVVEHKNWRTGKRPKDRADAWTRGRLKYVEEDIQTRNLWITSGDYWDTLDRVSRRCPLDTVEQEEAATDIRQAIRRTRLIETPKPDPGIPLARMIRQLEEKGVRYAS